MPIPPGPGGNSDEIKVFYHSLGICALSLKMPDEILQEIRFEKILLGKNKININKLIDKCILSVFFEYLENDKANL